MASERAASRRAPPFIDPPGYARHRPEQTLLYRLVEQYYPEFLAVREAAERALPQWSAEGNRKHIRLAAACLHRVVDHSQDRRGGARVVYGQGLASGFAAPDGRSARVS